MGPLLVKDSTAGDTLSTKAVVELVSRNCKLKAHKKLSNINAIKVSGTFTAYASPDSTFAVTKQLLDAAQRSIVIGIYDFSAGYVKDIVLNAMLHRGVKVSLMLDLDGLKGELPIFNELKRFGCKAVPAPSCASKRAHFFRSSHEKVIVIDDEVVLVQSGNYSPNSIPLNATDGGDPDNFVPGNRDMGVAVRSKALATFFTKVLQSDMKLELDASGVATLAALVSRAAAPVDMVDLVPSKRPATLFPSKTFKPAKPIAVTPVLSPDNYMDVVPGFIEAAEKSVLIEQQYIRGSQDAIKTLLGAIRAAKTRHPDLDVRIILGKLFSAADVEKERKNLAFIKKQFGLQLGKNIRFIDTTRFVHCHNKLILVDGQAALVSSQNWSDAAVLENREAGLLIEYPDVARYYAKIFENDWTTAKSQVPSAGGPASVGVADLSRGRFMPVSIGDYIEV